MILKTPYALIALALVAGIAIGVYFQSEPATSIVDLTKNTTTSRQTHSSSPDSLYAELAELKNLLQNEIEVREMLERKVDSLSQQIVVLEDNSQTQINTLSEQTEETQSTETEAQDIWFKEQALVDSGMSASQANELKVFFEQQELQRLYLRDQSIREGWDRQKFRDEMTLLANEEDSLKDRLGEDAFDAYLYASGQSNRVAVSSVLATAPAGEAGIQAGDHILRYDNQRVYSGFELRRATTTGDDNDSVAVEVERDGKIIEFYLPRGPLGIRMNSISKAP